MENFIFCAVFNNIIYADFRTACKYVLSPSYVIPLIL